MFKNQNEALSFIERNYNLLKNIFNLYKYKIIYKIIKAALPLLLFYVEIVVII